MKDLIHSLFSLDVRALALARVCIALVALYDVIQRFVYSHLFFGENSYFPFEAWLTSSEGNYVAYWNIHWFAEDLNLVSLLFIVHIVCLVFVLFGYKTKIATIGAWLLFVSLNHAVPPVLFGTDSWLLIVMFLGMFLPWSTVWSVDAGLSKNQHSTETRILTPWTVVYLFQVTLIYVSASQYKTGSDWLDGSAVYYALSLDSYRYGLGNFTLQHPTLMYLLTYGVWWFQRIVPFLLFLPIYTSTFRTIGVLGLMFMHLGFALHLKLGIFSFIAIASLVALLPSSFFDFLEKLAVKCKFGNIQIYYDGECGFCKNSVYIFRSLFLLPKTRLETAQSVKDIHRDMVKYDSWVVVDKDGNRSFEYNAMLTILKASPILFWSVPLLSMRPCLSIGRRVYRFVANHRARGLTCSIESENPSQTTQLRKKLLLSFSFSIAAVYVIAVSFMTATEFDKSRNKSYFRDYYVKYSVHALGLTQKWSLFAPNPGHASIGFVYMKLTLETGKILFITPTFRQLNDVAHYNPSTYYATPRLLKYFESIVSDGTRRKHVDPKYFLMHACTTWNNTYSTVYGQIANIEFFGFEKTTLPNYAASPYVSRSLGMFTCNAE